MAKILRSSDRIEIKMDEVTFVVAPLTFEQKMELAKASSMNGGESIVNLMEYQKTYIKYALKDIGGVEDYAGNPYKLEFDGDQLSEKCINDIFSIEQRSVLTSAAYNLLNGFTEKLTDAYTGEVLENVELKVVSSGE